MVTINWNAVATAPMVLWIWQTLDMLQLSKQSKLWSSRVAGPRKKWNPAVSLPADITNWCSFQVCPFYSSKDGHQQCFPELFQAALHFEAEFVNPRDISLFKMGCYLNPIVHHRLPLLDWLRDGRPIPKILRHTQNLRLFAKLRCGSRPLYCKISTTARAFDHCLGSANLCMSNPRINPSLCWDLWRPHMAKLGQLGVLQAHGSNMFKLSTQILANMRYPATQNEISAVW